MIKIRELFKDDGTVICTEDELFEAVYDFLLELEHKAGLLSKLLQLSEVTFPEDKRFKKANVEYFNLFYCNRENTGFLMKMWKEKYAILRKKSQAEEDE